MDSTLEQLLNRVAVIKERLTAEELSQLLDYLFSNQIKKPLPKGDLLDAQKLPLISVPVGSFKASSKVITPTDTDILTKFKTFTAKPSNDPRQYLYDPILTPTHIFATDGTIAVISPRSELSTSPETYSNQSVVEALMTPLFDIPMAAVSNVNPHYLIAYLKNVVKLQKIIRFKDDVIVLKLLINDMAILVDAAYLLKSLTALKSINNLTISIVAHHGKGLLRLESPLGERHIIMQPYNQHTILPILTITTEA